MRVDLADDDVTRACHAVQVAVLVADSPDRPPLSLPVFRAWLTAGWQGNPSETWCLAGDRDGDIAGWYRMELPDLENLERAALELNVHPAARRQGAGSLLLRHAAQRAQANGRSLFVGFALDGSPGEAFARRAGAAADIQEARRVLDLRTVPTSHFADLRAEAADKAAGYTLVRWTGPVPEDRLGQVAGMYDAMADAPHSAGHQPSRWDAKRVRERTDVSARLAGVRSYAVAAVHEASGEMAGLTLLEVDPEMPEWGHQAITAVTRPHRGHRLGLLTKATMAEWLAEAEPQLEMIDTGNAPTNKHMIAVNEALGYRLAEPGWQIFQLPVAAVLPLVKNRSRGVNWCG